MCPLPSLGGAKHHPPVQPWSFSCLMAGHGGHLCPSHLVAPDILKGSLVWVILLWDRGHSSCWHMVVTLYPAGWTQLCYLLVHVCKSDVGAASFHGCLGEETSHGSLGEAVPWTALPRGDSPTVSPVEQAADGDKSCWRFPVLCSLQDQCCLCEALGSPGCC